MQQVTSWPYVVTTDENVRIKMSDGVRLTGRIWRPANSGEQPVPALLEFIPYRHRDLTAYRDSINHPYLAGHGYAAVRVDLRGSGESEGVLTGEYLEQELTDAEEVLAWLAGRPAVVHRAHRHDGYFLGRVQRAATGGPATAEPGRNRDAVLDRRSLRR